MRKVESVLLLLTLLLLSFPTYAGWLSEPAVVLSGLLVTPALLVGFVFHLSRPRNGKKDS